MKNLLKFRFFALFRLKKYGMLMVYFIMGWVGNENRL